MFKPMRKVLGRDGRVTGSGSKMNNQLLQRALPFGLLELDATGTVIRYSPAAAQNLSPRAGDILGRDFIKEVAPIEQVQDFRERFHGFMMHGEATHKFSTTFPLDGGSVKVQILLAHITEKSEHGRQRLAPVRIMPEIASAIVQ